ncbi:MAG: Flagellar basal body-associated protein FliL [Candidatus Methanoperedenaceae archaeon GB37]|nr:MAG: Flagellar basal body-associated protein FliL [Candidatus Methanoperedenaceae archaeon GB37]
MSLRLEGQDTQKEIEKKLPKIRDSLLMLLSSKSVEEISTLQGKLVLKNEIINRINSILNTGHVSAVYFTEVYNSIGVIIWKEC